MIFILLSQSSDKKIGGLDNNYMDFERSFSNTI